MSPRVLGSSRRMIALAAALGGVLLAGCSSPDEREPGGYDPRVDVADCLRDEGLSARLADRTAIDAEGVHIEFLITPGEAEARQLEGRAQGAEQIGRALVWVGRAPDELLETIEGCVDA